MDWPAIIGLIFTGLSLIGGVIWWAFRQGRGVGVAETVLKHEDESLNTRVGKIEDDIREIRDMLSGTEFWSQMRTLIKEVKGETKRHERPPD